MRILVKYNLDDNSFVLTNNFKYVYNHYFSQNLDLSIRKINSIIRKHNGINIRQKIHLMENGKWFYGYIHHFEKRKDAEACLETLEPYIILKNLTEN
jgi:hypothetical protein